MIPHGFTVVENKGAYGYCTRIGQEMAPQHRASHIAEHYPTSRPLICAVVRGSIAGVLLLSLALPKQPLTEGAVVVGEGIALSVVSSAA